MTTGRGATRIDVFLASLQHPDLSVLEGSVDGVTLDGTLRVANWRHTFTSQGRVFAPGFFRVRPPKAGDRRGNLQVILDNVDQRVTEVVDALTGRASLTLEMVYADAPDTIRNTWSRMELKLFGTDKSDLRGTFGPPPTEGPFMGIKIDRTGFPGAHS
ncbi:MAG: hypothetical protein AAFW60_01550 [Pseudomonadota bacterium]